MSGSDRVASLDLLRGAAALAVAACHFLAYQGISPGWSEAASALAVEVFFVLSGFVLAPQIVACAQARSVGALRIFLVRRWMRTVPPYLVALACATVISNTPEPSDVLRYALYVQNLFHQANGSDYFPIAWSLSVEEWFYVSFPALVMVAALLTPRCDAAAVALAFIVAISLGRILAGDSPHWGYDVRRVVIFRIDSIAYGMLLFAALERWTIVPTMLAGGVLAIVAGAVAFATLLMIDATNSAFAKQLFPFAAALFGASAILAFLSLGHVIDRRPAVLAFAVYLGRISYSVYLFHLIVLIAIASHVDRERTLVSAVLYVTGLIGFCSVFYALFEKPILAARPRFSFAIPRLAPHGGTAG